MLFRSVCVGVGRVVSVFGEEQGGRVVSVFGEDQGGWVVSVFGEEQS